MNASRRHTFMKRVTRDSHWHSMFVDPDMTPITRQGVFECSSIIAKPCQSLIAIMTPDQLDQGNCFPRDVGLQIGKTGFKQVLMKV